MPGYRDDSAASRGREENPMNDAKIQPAPALATPRSRWLHPGLWLVLIGNLYPLAGVVWWGWDAFLLLTLYWMETVVIAFWTVVRIALSRAGGAGTLAGGGGRPVRRPLALAAFFTVHAGLFIVVHFIFLWSLFSGNWAAQAGGVRAFFERAIFNEGLWAPLLILFVARGIYAIGPILLRLWVHLSGRPQGAANPGLTMGELLDGLYRRIVVMQVAIIAGGWFAMAIGSMAPLILLIALKTFAELFWKGGLFAASGPVQAKPPAAS